MRRNYLLLVISPIISAILDVDLITNYLEYKHLQIGSIFSCLSKRDQVHSIKILMDKGFRFTILNINDNLDFVQSLSSHNNQGLILDASCNNILVFLKKCEQQNLFDGTKKHWLIVASNETFLTNLENINININVDMNIALTNNSNKTHWNIFDVYNPAFHHGGNMKITYIGYYVKTNGYQINVDKSIYLKRRNLTGIVFHSMIVLPYPYKGTLEEYIASDENMTINTFNRASYRSLFYCRDFYNFTMLNIESKSWGYKVAGNNTFDGLVGALQSKQVDFGSGIFAKQERIPYIDYGPRVYLLRHAFIFKNPSQSSSFTAFLKPLSSLVWYTTFALIFVMVVILKYTLNFEYVYLKNVTRLCENTWSFLILTAVGTICQHGAERTPFLYCGRIITVTVLLFSILLFQVYSASIVSNLLLKPPSTITSLYALLHSDFEVACENVLYMKYFFTQLTNPATLELYHKKILKNGMEHYLTPIEGLQNVYNGKFAYHAELSNAYQIIDKTFPNSYVCDLVELEMIPPTGIYIPFQKHSPFQEMISYCMLRLREIGLYEYVLLHWSVHKPICITEAYKTESVGIFEFYPILIMLAIGMVISLIVFIIEIMVKRKILEDKKKSKGTKFFVKSYCSKSK